ncbi:MAG: CPBP family intramembrane metalloprotease [Bacteroidota bacterium]|nr:CPBP family intramembrane metalloprotease [Bacteroidota bacterium]
MEDLLTPTTPETPGETPFMTAAFTGRNAFWRYFTGSITPFLASNLIGSLPLLAVMFTSTVEGVIPQKGGMPDFEAMGINLNLGFVLSVFPFILALLAIILLVKPLHDRSFGTVINGGRKIRWGRIFLAAIVWIAVSALWMVYSLKSDPGNFRLNNTSGSLVTLALLAFALIPFQAAFEEILFRGYLMQGFAVWTRNRWLPVILTSVLFGLMHGLNPEVKQYGFLTMMPQYIFFGLLFAALTMLDDGIEVAIGAHSANNIFLSVLITNKDMALQTPAMYEQIEIYPWKDFAGLVEMSLVFLVIMALVYRWKDFRKLYAGIIAPAPAFPASEAV